MPIVAMPQLNITFFVTTIITITLIFLILLWIIERKYLPKIASILKTRKKLNELTITGIIIHEKLTKIQNDIDITSKLISILINNLPKKIK